MALRALVGFLEGARLCFRDPAIRRLAIRPWLFGALGYLAALFGAIHLHPTVVQSVASEPTGFWSSVLYWAAWALAGVMLLVAAAVVALLFTLLLGGLFQTAIAEEILRRKGFDIAEVRGISGISGEVLRTILTEAVKLMWVVPVMIMLFVLGLIPLLTIPAAVAGGWLLGYTSFDVPLDALRTSALQRLGFSLRNPFLITTYGLLFMAVSIIPFLGILLAPVAVAGAATILSATQDRLLSQKTK